MIISVDPDQTAPSRSGLIWVYTTRLDILDPILRILGYNVKLTKRAFDRIGKLVRPLFEERELSDLRIGCPVRFFSH